VTTGDGGLVVQGNPGSERGGRPATYESWTGDCEATRSGSIGLAETRGNGYVVSDMLLKRQRECGGSESGLPESTRPDHLGSWFFFIGNQFTTGGSFSSRHAVMAWKCLQNVTPRYLVDLCSPVTSMLEVVDTTSLQVTSFAVAPLATGQTTDFV